MSGNKNKTTKRQRTPRVVPPSEYKRVNRGGSGKPQPRRITNAAKVAAIQNAVLKEAKQFLAHREIELTAELEMELKFLTGLSEQPSRSEEATLAIALDEPSGVELAKSIKAAEKAFYHGCKLVPDSQFAMIDEHLAIPGRAFSFFALLQEQDERDAQERRQRNQNRNRRAGGRAHVARLVAQASGLSA